MNVRRRIDRGYTASLDCSKCGEVIHDLKREEAYRKAKSHADLFGHACEVIVEAVHIFYPWEAVKGGAPQ